MTNKDLIELYSNQLWNQKDLTIIPKVFTDQTQIHSPLTTTKGASEMQTIAQKWLTAFPDMTCTWTDFISEGNLVVSRWQATGTHRHEFNAIAPTHKKIQYQGISTYRLENNKVVEYWALADMHGLLEQLQN